MSSGKGEDEEEGGVAAAAAGPVVIARDGDDGNLHQQERRKYSNGTKISTVYGSTFKYKRLASAPTEEYIGSPIGMETHDELTVILLIQIHIL